jgi:hypothetical protein
MRATVLANVVRAVEDGSHQGKHTSRLSFSADPPRFAHMPMIARHSSLGNVTGNVLPLRSERRIAHTIGIGVKVANGLFQEALGLVWERRD